MTAIRQPVIRTARLLLRGFRAGDVEPLHSLANDIDVARNTLNIPHPYGRQDAQAWIDSQADRLRHREAVTCAVTLSGSEEGDGPLVGAVGLILAAEHERAELGYWIGRPYWGQGYATEAAAAVVAWGFEVLELHRIHATHFPHNAASGNVLRKLGMVAEGTLRHHVKKWEEFLDLEVYGILRAEWASAAAPGPE